jgi:hypothetical protein
MSNAFNLSQLANFVDSSGKVNISTGSTGTLPTTQGGTGLTTVGTNGQILQSNGTTLSYVTPSSGGVTSLNGQTGAIVDTTQYAIGSYIFGRPQDINTYNNTTIAGSSLYVCGSQSVYSNVSNEQVPIGWSGLTSISPSGNGLINTGSWRCVSPAYGYNAAPGSAAGAGGLWVRYA